LKLDLAQFRELEAFATFGSELDALSKAQLERGARLVELLKQPLHAPMTVEEQVVSIFAGTKGYLDAIPVADVRRFEDELIEYMRTRHVDIMTTIRNEGTLAEGKAKQALDDFTANFRPTETEGAAADATASTAEGAGPETSEETLRTE
jgi:F-type H+/Na+-transporting ATPase subunit alpha